MLLQASSSEEFCRSQWWKEMVSSSRALGCAQGSVGADVRRECVQQDGQLVHFRGGGFADGEGVPRVQGAFAVGADVDGLAFAVAGVGLQPQLVEQPEQFGLVRGNPLAADFEHGAVNGIGPGPAADAVPRLQDGHAQAGLFQFPGCGEPGGAGSDDDDVAVNFQHDVLSVAAAVMRTTK